MSYFFEQLWQVVDSNVTQFRCATNPNELHLTHTHYIHADKKLAFIFGEKPTGFGTLKMEMEERKTLVFGIKNSSRNSKVFTPREGVK